MLIGATLTMLPIRIQDDSLTVSAMDPSTTDATFKPKMMGSNPAACSNKSVLEKFMCAIFRALKR